VLPQDDDGSYYLVAMMAPRVLVKSVFEKLPAVWVGKISEFDASMRLSSMSVRWLAATYDSVSVPDSTELEVWPGQATMLQWLLPKYSPRSAIEKGSATVYLMPRFTPYQTSFGDP